MRNTGTYEFIDSAFNAGFPYVMEIQAKLDGKLDITELGSYKESVYAWRDAMKNLGEIFRWYDGVEKDRVTAVAHIWKCEPGTARNRHTLICTIGSFDHGSYRNVIRHPDSDPVRIR